jgi:hypothetical protein
MSRLHMLIISLFTVALGTGIVVGMGMTRAPASPHEGHSWLVDRLQLSPQQSDELKAVWSDNLRDSWKRHSDAVRQYRKERDDAMLALLTPEQKAAYDKIVERYSAEITEMNREQEAQFQAAADRTKQILNDHQRGIYEELLKKGFRGGPWGPPRDGPGGPPGMHPDGGHEGHRHGATSTSQPGAI